MRILSEKNGLFWGTVFLLASNIIVKGLGFFYRVALVRLLGTEGVGLIEMVSSIFSFLIVLGGCGIQTSLSQIIASKRGEEGRTCFHTAFILLLISSTVLTAVAYIFSPWLINSFAPDQRIFLCFKSILPAIIIISLASAYRGLFQGIKQVGILGISQNAEQIIRVAVGIVLVGVLSRTTLEIQVSAASVATVCGELTGFLILLLLYFRSKKAIFHEPTPKKNFSFKAAGDLLSMGMPLTASRLVASGIMMIQAILIPLCLQAGGWEMRAATEIYGRFAGVALALLHLPGVFTAALSVSVLPAVAESMTYDISGRRVLQQRVNVSLQAASSFTLLGMILLFIFSVPLCTLIFDNQPAAPLLRLLTLGGCFLYLQLTLASILLGLGEAKSLLVNNIISGIILIAGIAFLTPLPSLGIKGAAIAINISWLCGFSLNLSSFYRKGRVRLDWGNIAAKPVIAAGVALVGYYSLELFLPHLLQSQSIAALLVQSLLVIMVYLLCLHFSGGMIKIPRRK